MYTRFKLNNVSNDKNFEIVDNIAKPVDEDN